MAPTTGQEIIELLDLVPLPEEGGRYRQTFRDEHSTAIYYLLISPEFSAFHKVPGMEAFHFYAGAPARLVMLTDKGHVDRAVLGVDLHAGQRPQAIVPGGVWQALETLGEWTLCGTTMAPGYRDVDFSIADASGLLEGWPDAEPDIRRLTR